MPATPGFAVLLLCQALGASGETFGQRCTRVLYRRNNARTLLAVVVYSALQAFVLLGIAEIVLPYSWTQGQGSLSMWALIWQHPGLLLNALVNTFYWIAQVYVLREPLGVIMVVLAFLIATFFIDPFAAAVGMPTQGELKVGAIITGLLGAACCLFEFSIGTVRRHNAFLKAACSRETRSPHGGGGAGSTSPPSLASTAEVQAPLPPLELAPTRSPRRSVDSSGSADGGEGRRSGGGRRGGDQEESVQLITADGGSADIHAAGRSDDGTASHHPVPIPSHLESRLPWPTTPTPRGFRLGDGSASSLFGVAVAFATLAVTAGMGIVITKYFEEYAGLSSFGYAAVDQVMLPFTLMPVVYLANRYPTVALWLGDQPGPAQPFAAMVKATWSETSLPTLVPFRLLMFIREFLFFYLATKFDLAPTYLQMTLLRVVLSWVASLLACSLLRWWVGVSKEESERTLAPTNLLLKLIGTGLVTWSIVILQQTG